eukprot:CAMPEP_0194690740 /NCGR_PEP_ID=MMETSP0295-20121207/18538_1 /TAXON_ID=39354 /ORGANISM="Heterosigma akashiwo, Strain CCMP2393" /LENGTH=63 /DNA_ID=CAMNT_0039580333 /DNA_START=68 /DNA_END=259 /DNA_ORIENTATION=-
MTQESQEGSMGNFINSDDEGSEGSPPLLHGHFVLVDLQSRRAVEDTAVRDAAREKHNQDYQHV